MTMIIHIVLLAVLIICVWGGYKKGIIMGVGGILAIIISLYGANLLATTFSYDVIPALRPFASGFMEGRLDAKDGPLEKMAWDKTNYSVDDLLARYPERTGEFCTLCYETLGIDGETAERMSAEAVEHAETNGGSVMDAVVQILCEKICFVSCFILAFLLLIILLTVIGNLPNLSYKIPNLDVINDIGGILLGLVEGVAFCMLIVWVLKFFGAVIGEDTLHGAWLTDLLLEKNIITNYIGL